MRQSRQSFRVHGSALPLRFINSNAASRPIGAMELSLLDLLYLRAATSRFTGTQLLVVICDARLSLRICGSIEGIAHLEHLLVVGTALEVFRSEVEAIVGKQVFEDTDTEQHLVDVVVGVDRHVDAVVGPQVVCRVSFNVAVLSVCLIPILCLNLVKELLVFTLDIGPI